MFRLIFALVLCVATARADRWEIAYHYDEDESDLVLTDLKFSSELRGIALGAIVQRSGREKPVALVTSDAGASWNIVETKEIGQSLFLLDDSSGWMVTRSGIWYTDEGGRNWRRIHKKSGLNAVVFTSAERGFAIGSRKTVIQTSDGGKSWTDVPEVTALKTSEAWTSFRAIDFATPQFGLITGNSRQPSRREMFMPPWLEPDPERQRERPSLSVSLETRDGGKTWRSSTSSMFGTITDIKLAPDFTGLVLVQFERYFGYAAEVFALKVNASEAQRVLRTPDLAITAIDIASNTVL
ncbi:MAG TPA: hypothetical protein VEQ63_02150, partial [Bryobacteraceae bacterium]|nr:hypothetical protein [Bryobacteraceae bacterium]